MFQKNRNRYPDPKEWQDEQMWSLYECLDYEKGQIAQQQKGPEEKKNERDELTRAPTQV